MFQRFPAEQVSGPTVGVEENIIVLMYDSLTTVVIVQSWRFGGQG